MKVTEKTKDFALCLSSYASLALMQTFLEQRHQRAMVELEQDMGAELEKERDELNRQMEMELQKELQVRGCSSPCLSPSV